MSETNQEDMSVEDILSSIKNILVDENGAPIADQVAAPAPEAPKPAPQNPQLQRLKPVDDIFDLDSSMIVDDQTAAQDISRLLETTEPKPQPATRQDTPVSRPAPVQPAKAAEISAPAQNNEQTPIQTPVPQPAPAAAVKEVSEEAIDASAGIINNFAKLFAEKQQQEANAAPAATAGIAAKVDAAVAEQNISDMVKNAIVSQVKICLDSNFEKLAADIIAEQTQNWLNQNLAAIVEKTVAREIERVIAKVGS